MNRNPHREKQPVPADQIIPDGIRDRAIKAIRKGPERRSEVQRSAGKSFHGKFYRGRGR